MYVRVLSLVVIAVTVLTLDYVVMVNTIAGMDQMNTTAVSVHRISFIIMDRIEILYWEEIFYRSNQFRWLLQKALLRWLFRRPSCGCVRERRLCFSVEPRAVLPLTSAGPRPTRYSTFPGGAWCKTDYQIIHTAIRKLSAPPQLSCLNIQEKKLIYIYLVRVYHLAHLM